MSPRPSVRLTEREKWDRHFPELRIVSDELWDAAQVRLAEVGGAHCGPRRRNGQLTGSKPGRQDPTPRHLLAGLLHCAECGLTFHVSGARGDYLGCRGYFTGRCGCETRIPRARAAQMILDAIAETGARRSGLAARSDGRAPA